MIEVRIRFIKALYRSDTFSIYSAEAADLKDSRLVKENDYGNFTISGDYSLDDEDLGTVYKVSIEEDYASRYPNSYKMHKIHYEFPTTAIEQWRYLKDSNVVPIGTYLSIKKEFSKSDKILDIIVENPSELTRARGIGQERARMYQKKLLENKEKAALFTEYGNIEGVGASIINSLLHWKPSVEEIMKDIKKDPFSLLVFENIGFVLADRFREHYKYPMNDKNRILHGVMYFLEEDFQNTGDTYDSIFSAAKKAAGKLLVSYKEVILLLAEIKNDQKSLDKYKIKIFGKNITTKTLYMAEYLVYNKTKDIMEDKQNIIPEALWQKNKDAYLSKLNSKLSKEQNDFLNLINKERISVLLGPGGSGKSWVINIACDLIMKANKTFALFAPTARAAHVMTSYVGVEAKTIHRGLMKHAIVDEPAPYDVLIVDEFSMVDSELASIVLKTMGEKTRLIIVGDDFQLQSVGPGNILFDLVQYLDMPTVRLTKIFRQEKGSGILDYAKELRDGTFLLPTSAPRIESNDIVFINESNEDRKQEIALKLYKQSLEKYGVDDIMLLSPVNKGSAGRSILNNKVQELVNPSRGDKEIVLGANSRDASKTKYFRKGDYITVKKNNYEIVDDKGMTTELINGDLGIIEMSTKKELTFSSNNHDYTIEKTEINDLIDHAWAITIHKSQGGQASEVIIVLPQNSYFMLNSNMLYTAITRAKIKCYIIGSFNGINEASKKQANFTRKTIIQLQVLNKKLNEKELKEALPIKPKRNTK